MRSRKQKSVIRAVALATLVIGAAAQAQGIVFSADTIHAQSSQPAYAVRLDALDGGYDEIVFTKTDSTPSFLRRSTLTYATSTLAAYINLYGVQEGETFADSSLAMGSNTLPSLLNGGIVVSLSRLAAQPTYFYLGLRTHSPAEWGLKRSALGWILLENTQLNGLRMVDSYVAYGANQIVIGEVPEVGSMSLVAFGLITLLVARRQHRPLC